MKFRPALTAAVLLPLIGFGASWAMTHQKAQLGTDWDVPIAGYDPRDFLRGHYLQFRFDWPGLEAENDRGIDWGSTLCIEGRAPNITKTIIVERDEQADCTHKVRHPDDDMTDLINGRFYVPQTRAAGYEDKLRDPKLQSIMRVRIREDGLMTPKSLHFRPLTAAEIKARAEREVREAEQQPTTTLLSQ